ncbi:Gfo/Idh/MocA family oxidoreductase [Sphaerotilus mobilis]|uniref:Myo-inositol 2-dehydrogenase/D-chiro-inositol 1-dehydrogenase n=1 Tax=Sphaerotilus mobilis TaxID=47994 RepID=A0A4Q7L9B3_9BURK|nr:Gfo/Idh/MocA family oxidoreductase [Sphaerotilus mobilis]RZS46657.1 myo-inositol 2-dehydrogenase/D-chiro-inositol 1-dehydrogenase [Sphaerotilus mobilis]
MSPTSPLKVGIVGLGRLGRRHASYLARRMTGARLVSACNPSMGALDWARDELGVERLHQDYDRFIAEADLDAVVLASPTTEHPRQFEAALRAGKHVFVEKPLALDLATCESLTALAQACPEQVAMVGFERRFDPDLMAAQAAVARGELGRPYMVRSQTCDMNDPNGFFVRFSATSGGIFNDCSVHDIDLARWMLGNPRALKVFASGTIALHPDLARHHDVDNGMAIIEFEGGARAMLYASRTMPHGHETTLEVIGTEGTVQVGYGAQAGATVYRSARGVHHPVLPDFYARFEQAFFHEMDAFVAACLGHGDLPATLADATEATRIALALTQSFQSGQAVSL